MQMEPGCVSSAGGAPKARRSRPTTRQASALWRKCPPKQACNGARLPCSPKRLWFPLSGSSPSFSRLLVQPGVQGGTGFTSSPGAPTGPTSPLGRGGLAQGNIRSAGETSASGFRGLSLVPALALPASSFILLTASGFISNRPGSVWASWAGTAVPCGRCGGCRRGKESQAPTSSSSPVGTGWPGWRCGFSSQAFGNHLKALSLLSLPSAAL